MRTFGWITVVLFVGLPIPQLLDWLRDGIAWTGENEQALAAMIVLWLMAFLIASVLIATGHPDMKNRL